MATPGRRPDSYTETEEITIPDANSISDFLIRRLAKEKYFTRIGNRVMVSIRPSRGIALFSDATSKEYAANAKLISNQSTQTLSPHVFDISASAYFHSLRSQQDQSIVLLGSAGSGKSNVSRIMIRNLCDLSKTSSKKSKIHSNVLKVDSVLGAFGNATTTSNPDASCFSLYTEVQFDQKGRMVGAKYIEYLLDIGRVCRPSDGGTSFHIFYYLLEGATYEERIMWHLSDSAHFHYLGGSNLVGYAQGKKNGPLDVLRTNLKALGIGKRLQAQLWQLLAAILHLGNIQFNEPASERFPCSIKNFPQLQMVAEMLGVSPSALQSVLTTRTRMVGKDNISSFLDVAKAMAQRDAFARSLYSVCFGWIIEQINQKLCAPDQDWAHFVSIVELAGFAGSEANDNGYHRLLVNYANERLFGYTMNEIFVSPAKLYQAQEIEFPTQFASNKEIIACLSELRDGIIPLANTAASRNTNPTDLATNIYERQLDSGVLVTASSKNLARSFGVHHYHGIVHYDTKDFVDVNSDVLQSDFVTLIRGDPENPGTSNSFLRSLFSDRLVATRKAADSVTVVAAKSRSRTPSMKRRPSRSENDDGPLDVASTVGHIFENQLNTLIDTLYTTQSWFIYNLKQGPVGSAKVNPETILSQVSAFDLRSLVNHPHLNYTINYTYADFVERYSTVITLNNRDPKIACGTLARIKNWKPTECALGATSIFLAEAPWRELEYKLMAKEAEIEKIKNEAQSPKVFNLQDDAFGVKYYEPSYNGSEVSDDTASHYESEFEYTERNAPVVDVEMGNMKKFVTEEANKASTPKKPLGPAPVKPLTSLRKRWLCFTWFSTCCFSPCCLSLCCLRGRDRQLAWREKFALCLIILFMNLFALFVIIGTGYIICPKDPRAPQQSPGEISGFFESDDKASVHMYGSYYRIPEVIARHVKQYMDQSSSSPEYFKAKVNGRDVTWMFKRQDNPSLVLDDRTKRPICNFPVPASFVIASEEQPTNTKWYPHKPDSIKTVEQYRKGPIVVGKDFLNKQIAESGGSRRFIIVYDKVYDLSPFYNPVNYPTSNTQFFLGKWFTDAANSLTGSSQIRDGSPEFSDLAKQNPQVHDNIMNCLNNLFFIGSVDHRNDLECIIANYLLLSASVMLVAVIGFKFLGALQFSGPKSPEDHDRFVICQVPCYTEGETSLHRTIDSLTNLRYDDKHKLLFIICDGMIIGSGNDRPTPRIVLDILGVDPAVDPEAKAYQSLGNDNEQLNYGKVYSGLYELNGHVVPYIVVVKVGKPSERGRPGNRGKRDSQLVLMRFLMRVHFNQPMSPLDLEIYHHMKNIIGVDPSFYEYVFMVDADTQVHQDSLNHLVSHMTRDAKIAGTCGETSIANDRKSFTSMIQVYEYFISHHMAKAFESLFGSVTCLPGCFCMYRVRTPYKNTPVLIAPGLISDYSENTVDTLHLKNLLHLGEDRYLTTLTMKHFPNMKTTFCADAKCQTYAPDKWPVLLSQRRRWINSTVHNLFELLRLGELCGFCCFSMRFVVFIDLIATFIQPSSLMYVAYLVFLASTDNLGNVPVISLILIAAVYGFQIIIFLLKTQWQHIGWMIFYLLAIPVFGLYIPIYSFWHFDDFSWGNTRVVVETADAKSEKKKEPEYFDPASVPLMKWSDYEGSKTESSEENKSKGYGGPPGSIYAGSIAEDSCAAPSVAGSGRFPSDEELLNEIRHILSTTDLMKVTKKSVRDSLSRLFGVDVTPRKDYIHYCIDKILKGE